MLFWREAKYSKTVFIFHLPSLRPLLLFSFLCPPLLVLHRMSFPGWRWTQCRARVSLHCAPLSLTPMTPTMTATSTFCDALASPRLKPEKEMTPPPEFFLKIHLFWSELASLRGRCKIISSQAPSYASPKLRPTYLLTDSRAGPDG